MNPESTLKWSGIAFAVLWTGLMLWWNGSFDLPNVIILSICGAAAGYGWYRVMRWLSQRRGTLPRSEP